MILIFIFFTIISIITIKYITSYKSKSEVEMFLYNFPKNTSKFNLAKKDWILNFDIRINIPSKNNCTLVSYKDNPLIVHKYTFNEPQHSENLVYQIHKLPIHVHEICITSNFIKEYQNDNENINDSHLYIVNITKRNKLNIQIESNNNILSIYIDNVPIAEIPLKPIDIIPENIILDTDNGNFSIIKSTDSEIIQIPLHPDLAMKIDEYLPSYFITSQSKQVGNQIKDQLEKNKEKVLYRENKWKPM